MASLTGEDAYYQFTLEQVGPERPPTECMALVERSVTPML